MDYQLKLDDAARAWNVAKIGDEHADSKFMENLHLVLSLLARDVTALAARLAALESAREQPPATGRAATGPRPPRGPTLGAMHAACALTGVREVFEVCDEDDTPAPAPVQVATDDGEWANAPMPCPFCEHYPAMTGAEHFIRVKCNVGCGAMGPAFVDRRLAIAAWNRVARAVAAQGGAR